MIANRLSVLLAERQLTIKDVVENTNLSRNTISNLINKNMNNSINMQTLNSLCMYLEIEPKGFFVYSPYDVKLHDLIPLPTDEDKNPFAEKKQFSLMTFVTHYNDPKNIINNIYLEDSFFSSSDSPSYEVTFQTLKNDDYINDDKKNLQELTDLIDSLNIMFKKVLKDKIEHHIISQISDYMNWTPVNNKNKKNNKVINCNFSFPWHHSINIEYASSKN